MTSTYEKGENTAHINISSFFDDVFCSLKHKIVLLINCINCLVFNVIFSTLHIRVLYSGLAAASASIHTFPELLLTSWHDILPNSLASLPHNYCQNYGQQWNKNLNPVKALDQHQSSRRICRARNSREWPGSVFTDHSSERFQSCSPDFSKLSSVWI